MVQPCDEAPFGYVEEAVKVIRYNIRAHSAGKKNKSVFLF